MMNCCGGFGWPMMFGMWLGITLWILLLAGLIWGLIRWLGRRPARPPMMLCSRGDRSRDLRANA